MAASDHNSKKQFLSVAPDSVGLSMRVRDGNSHDWDRLNVHVGDKVAGHLDFSGTPPDDRDGGMVSLHNIVVHPEHRGQGLGSRLLDAAKEMYQAPAYNVRPATPLGGDGERLLQSFQKRHRSDYPS